jgi:hypothetical protein
VFAGFGNGREHPFRQQFAELRARHKQLHFDVSYSRPAPAEQRGRDYDHRGYVDLARIQAVLPSPNFRFYLCGPPGLMESLVPALLSWGVPRERIYFEAFGPASVKGLADESAAIAAGPCRVEFTRSGGCFDWTGDDESLLEFAEAQGLPLDYGCRAGNCGQCIVAVTEGGVRHVKEPGVVLKPNECLTCIGVPQGDLVLDA